MRKLEATVAEFVNGCGWGQEKNEAANARELGVEGQCGEEVSPP